MTLREAACQYLVYQYACHQKTEQYQLCARVLQHFLNFAGDRPLAHLREGHIQRYLALVLAQQNLVELQETRQRIAITQSFWKWLHINNLVG